MIHDTCIVDNHTILGKTTLPQSLTFLLTLALHGSLTPPDTSTSVVFELLRVAANICMDHGKSRYYSRLIKPYLSIPDENRAYLLDAGLPQALVSLLEGYAEPVSTPPAPWPLKLSISHLKVIRTVIGVLLNSSIGFGTRCHCIICLIYNYAGFQIRSNSGLYLLKLL